MQDRYAGDHIDFIKFALLRIIVQSGISRVGLNWYKTDPREVDATNKQLDGGKTTYLDDDFNWRTKIDPQLFEELKTVVKSTRGIGAIQTSLERLNPGRYMFYERYVPIGHARSEWQKYSLSVLSAAQIRFLDPDNSPVDQTVNAYADPRKYALKSEIIEHAVAAPTICISHPPRIPRREHHAKINGVLGCSAASLQCSLYVASCGFHLISTEENANVAAEVRGCMESVARLFRDDATVHMLDKMADGSPSTPGPIGVPPGEWSLHDIVLTDSNLWRSHNQWLNHRQGYEVVFLDAEAHVLHRQAFGVFDGDIDKQKGLKAIGDKDAWNLLIKGANATAPIRLQALIRKL